MIRAVAVPWVLCAGACAVPAAPPRVEAPALRDHGLPASPIDVQHYALALVLDPPARSIEATARVDFTAREPRYAVELDLVGLDVRRVEDADGRALPFEHDGRRLAITLEKPLTAGEGASVAVSYGGRPRKGLWFSGDDEAGRPTQVFSQGQTDESRGWFPCQDHPSDRATSEVAVTVPEAWVTVGAGVLVSTVSAPGTRTDTWGMDRSHPCYLITLVAGELEQVHDRSGDVELIYTLERDLVPFLEPSLGTTPAILAFLSELTGLDYPYAKYGQAWVDNFPWGGMENITATTLTPLTLTDERGRRDADSIDLYVHEAAHQWFGDLFTCIDWSHAWLNEGFATYAECLWVERTEGVGAARGLVRRYQESWLEHALEEPQPTVSGRYREADDLFDADLYEGACARIDHLRFLLGDEVFFACLEAYVAEHADAAVDTNALRRTFERVSGQTLGWFFEQWFLRPGFPELDVAWEWNDEGGEVALRVEQLQDPSGGVPEVFRAPVEVEVRTTHGAAVHRIELDERVERIDLPAPARPLYVRFDKGSRLPKAVRWHASLSEWRALAELDDDPTGRVDAARALGGIAGTAGSGLEEREACAEALIPLLRGDPDPWVREEAAEALGAVQGDDARASLLEAVDTDAEAGVRVAALGALALYGPDRYLAVAADAVFEHGYSYGTMAAAARLYAAADPSGAFDWIEPRLARPSPHDALCERLIGVLEFVDDPRVYGACRRLATDRTRAPTARAAAVRRLAALRERPIDTASFLGELLSEPSFHLRSACVDALAELDNPESRRILRRSYAEAQSGGQRRTIEDALASGPD